jgi:hypothetical protein
MARTTRKRVGPDKSPALSSLVKAGGRTGVLVASVSTLWTFIVAVFLWWFAAPSLLFVVELIYDAVRRAKPV